MLLISKLDSAHWLRKFKVSSSVLNDLPKSDLITVPSNTNSAFTLKAAEVLNSLISLSLSTISLTVTDWTLPAESDGFIFFQRTGDNSKPTNLSKTLRACWALTKLIFILRGFSIAFWTAVFVISLKVIRLVSLLSNPRVSYKCHEIASPSRSSSVASHTISAALVSFFNSATTFCLSSETS